MSKLGKVGKYIGILIGVSALIMASLFTWVDRTPYQEMAYYESTSERLAQFPAGRTGNGTDTLQIGWAKVNLTPEEPAPLAGYGKRWGKKYSGVNDSIWVRAFVIDDGSIKSAIVSVDLLVMPPEVNQRMAQLLPENGFQGNYFTASHSHSSMGGWANGLVGRLFAGEYDPATIDRMVAIILEAVILADQEKAIAKVGYAAFKTEGLVYNRLVQDRGDIDPWLRMLQFVKQDGSRAIFASFAAHATCLNDKFVHLSGDYPGLLVQALESNPSIDFAAFGAGAMGSQGPVMDGTDQLTRATKIATELADQINIGLNFATADYTTEFFTSHLSVDLREPHFRISDNVRIRPWLFHLLVGDYPVGIKTLKIGKTLLIGTPCDFSGELVADLELQAREKGLNLMITSFNGGYIGYITKDQWYDEDLYETRTMSWYGPYNGAYFSDLISSIIDRY